MLLNCGVGEDLRVPWTARRSNQSILKEISLGCSLAGLMLKLKLQYFCCLMQSTDSFEKTLMLGKSEDRGVSGVSSSCGTRGGFLARHGEDLREPLVRRQGSQVSLRVARGSASWLSSHGRGLGPRDALKKDSRGLSQGAAGNPRFPRLLPGTLGNFPGCL